MKDTTQINFGPSAALELTGLKGHPGLSRPDCHRLFSVVYAAMML